MEELEERTVAPEDTLLTFEDLDQADGTKVAAIEEIYCPASPWTIQMNIGMENVEAKDNVGTHGLHGQTKPRRYTQTLLKIRAQVPPHLEDQVMDRDLNTLNSWERDLPTRNRGQLLRARQLQQQRRGVITTTSSLLQDVVRLDHGYAFGTALDETVFRLKYHHVNLVDSQQLCCLGQMGYKCRCSLCIKGRKVCTIYKMSQAERIDSIYYQSVLRQIKIKEESDDSEQSAVKDDIIFL